MFAMMAAGVLGQQGAAVGGGPDYVEKALELGATAVLDGAGDLSSDAVWTGVTEIAGPDGLTAVTGVDGTITLPAGVVGNYSTILAVIYADPIVTGINYMKAQVSGFTPNKGLYEFSPRRDAGGTQEARASFAGGAVKVDVGDGAVGASRWTLCGIGVSQNVPGNNTNLTYFGVGGFGTAVTDIVTNRGEVNFPRPTGTETLTITLPSSLSNAAAFAGIAVFNKLLTVEDVQQLGDTLPSLVAP